MEALPLVAIIQPASPPEKEAFERGTEILREMGIPFKSFVEFSESSSSFKAFIFSEILTSGKFSYVWAVRGGAGSIKLLPYLDELLKPDLQTAISLPTLIGFSDITTLFLYLWKRFRKKSLHAPMIVNLAETSSDLRKLLKQILLKTIKEIRLTGITYRTGHCRGLLLGGNLSIFSSLCGTPYFPKESSLILFFEDTREKPYRLERSLFQILLSLPKNSIKGLIFGDLGEVDPKELLRSIEEILPPEIVIAYNFPFGHIPENYPLVFGAEAELIAVESSAVLIVNLSP